MIPEKGQHVKCFMRSTMVLEGVVEDWTTTEVVLKSLDGQSIMIVHRPVEDIMLTKVVLATPEEIPEETPKRETPKELLDAKHDIREKLQEVMTPTGDIEVDKLNLEQLRQLVHDQDRQIIAQRRRQHFGSPGAPKRAVRYSSPYMPGKLPNTPAAIMARGGKK
jgi:hypothetical protein